MRITELYLKNFGKFTDTHFYLDENLHVFYGENEYGKSTIYAFIKAMLFGLERGRGRAAGKDDFSRYEPWENPNYYAGVMRFTCGERHFRLERQFDRYTKRTVLICEDDGEELSVEAGDLEMLLGGMTLSSFENTAAIGRMTAKPGQELADELKNYAANYCGTGGGGIDLHGALETLRIKKKTVEQKQRERRDIIDRRLERLRAQKGYIENESENLETELKEKRKELELCQKQQKNIEGENRNKERSEQNLIRRPADEDTAEKKSSMRNYILRGAGIASAVVGAAGLFWSLVSGTESAGNGRMGAFLFLLLLVIGVLIMAGTFIRIPEQNGKGLSREERTEETEQQEKQEKKIQKLNWECRRIREEWKEKQVQLENLQEQLKEADLCDGIFRDLETERQAIELAMQRLKSTADSLSKEFGARLNREASTVLSVITEGKYSRLRADESLELSVYHEGKWIPVERLSRGTVEQIYFSLRMASLNILYDEEVPVIFDDAFVFYDEKRLKSVLKWLREQPRQVIIFSCQRREEELLKIF